ncbi:unnamed protein product [Echinostoma caproni]|uniref:Uncharacterized protein n=1 Tax=Echinostoma caproni TaxID=27848 RepID=A0A183BDA7_9TREM|nr:unnamed protein product [Echinostoma caproni]
MTAGRLYSLKQPKDPLRKSDKRNPENTTLGVKNTRRQHNNLDTRYGPHKGDCSEQRNRLWSKGRQEVGAPEERGSGWSKNLDARRAGCPRCEDTIKGILEAQLAVAIFSPVQPDLT